MGQVKVIHFDKGEEWRDKEAQADLEKKSETIWNDLNDDQRTATLLIVSEALRQMQEDPSVWVPTSLIAENGHRLAIDILINFAEIDDEVVRRKVEAGKELQRAKDGLIEMERTLRPEEVVAE